MTICLMMTTRTRMKTVPRDDDDAYGDDGAHGDDDDAYGDSDAPDDEKEKVSGGKDQKNKQDDELDIDRF